MRSGPEQQPEALQEHHHTRGRVGMCAHCWIWFVGPPVAQEPIPATTRAFPASSSGTRTNAVRGAEEVHIVLVESVAKLQALASSRPTNLQHGAPGRQHWPGSAAHVSAKASTQGRVAF